MSPLTLPRPLAAILAALLVSLAIAPTANAHQCGNGRFAVGGYPQPHLVPDGYTYVPTPGGIWPWEAGGYGHGQTVGAGNLVAAVDQHARHCGGPIHVFGHSYGAAIVDTATLTLDGRDYAHRVHVHVTGSPRRPGGVEDTYRWMPGFRGPVHPPTQVGSYRSDCNVGRDIICSAPWPWDVVGNINSVLGYLGSGHVYGS